MPESDLRKVLDDAGIGYELLRHEHTESALAEAQALGIPAVDVAKTLVVKTKEGYVRAVLPASERIDPAACTSVLGAYGDAIAVAKPEPGTDHFPGFSCEDPAKSFEQVTKNALLSSQERRGLRS